MPEGQRSTFLDARTQEAAPSISLAPRNFDELWKFADMICKTDFVPNGFKGNPGAVIAAVQYGNEVGLKPMTSLRWIAVINGVPSVWGDGTLMLLRSHPRYEAHRELTADEALTAGYGECTIKAKGEEPKTVRFTIKQAEKAGLWGGKGATKEKAEQSPWYKYPGRMLQMRARAWAIRDALPEALGGLSLREEAEDYREPRDITPADEPRPAIAERRPLRKSERDTVAAEPSESESAEPAASEEENKAELLTPDQKTALTQALEAATVDEEALNRYLGMQYKIKALDELPAEHADEVLDWLNSQKA